MQTTANTQLDVSCYSRFHLSVDHERCWIIKQL